MCRSIVDIQSATAKIRRIKEEEKKKEERKKQDKNIMSASATQGGHKKSKMILRNPRKAPESCAI